MNSTQQKLAKVSSFYNVYLYKINYPDNEEYWSFGVINYTPLP